MPVSRTGKGSLSLLRRLGAVLAIATLTLFSACTRTDDPPPSPPGLALPSGSNAAAPHAAQKSPRGQPGVAITTDKRRPTWAELTAAQQQTLAPLAAEWNGLGPIRKKKWLEIADRYAKMPPDEQERLQTRMREWVQLTPEQRRIARESYSRAKKLDSEQKSAKWDHYQSLPEEEKQKLASKAEKKKNVVNLPRASTGSNKPMPAKPGSPVLPSAPLETSTAAASGTSSTTASAPEQPVESPVDALGGPLSYVPK